MDVGRENRSGPSSFYCSGAHHIKLKISIGSVVRERKRRLHAPATIYGCNVKCQRILFEKRRKDIFYSISTFWTRSMFSLFLILVVLFYTRQSSMDDIMTIPISPRTAITDDDGIR
jgi:hypothetical protein